MWLTKKMVRNWFQFPFHEKGFPKGMKGFVETSPKNVTMWKSELSEKFPRKQRAFI